MSIRREIESVLNSKRKIAEIVLIASVLGIIVNISSSFLFDKIIKNVNFFIFFIASSIVLVFLIVFTLFSPILKRESKFTGAIFLNKDRNIIVPFDYKFLSFFSDVIKCVTSQNDAYRKIWNDGSITKFDFQDEAPSATLDANAFVIEAVEYFILEQLSLCLSEYFNGKDGYKIFGRNDFPQFILNNRIMEHISRPLEQRSELFERRYNEEGVGRPIAIYRDGGLVYSLFELNLPDGTEIIKHSKSSFSISTTKFDIKFDIKFLGFSINTDNEFDKFLLKTDVFNRQAYQIELDIELKFRFFQSLFRGDWEHFYWVEIFLKSLEDKFSFQKYLESINWSTARTILVCGDKVKKGPAK